MKTVVAIVLAAVLCVGAATAHATQQQTGVARLSHAQQSAIVAAGEWHRGCPVWMSELRVVTYRYYGFDRGTHIGQIVVNERGRDSVVKVFAKLYAMRFPIRDGAFVVHVRAASRIRAAT